MRLLTLLFFVFLFDYAYSMTVLPNWDILFYNGDTLFVEKIFSKEIIAQVKKQQDFKRKSNPREDNWYTAYWKIQDGELFLLKVTNCRSDFCKELGKNDTLNISKIAKGKSIDGKVRFKLKEGNLFAHKRFILRYNRVWFPDYIENYHFRFNKDGNIQIDTLTKYIDHKDRLNRYSIMQVYESVYQTILDSLKINTIDSNLINLRIGFNITIDKAGELKEFEVFPVFRYDDSDTNALRTIFNDYLNFEPIKKKIGMMHWDELRYTNDDKINFEFRYSVDDKFFRDDFFEVQLNHWKTHEVNQYPHFIKSVYNN